MNTSSKNRSRNAFSLIEVLIAVGILAFAIPTMIGVFAVFSSTSNQTMERGEGASVVNVLKLYLNGTVTDAGSSNNVSFATVYGWVYAAQQGTTNKVLYVYKTNATNADYLVSTNTPTKWDGSMLAARIVAPATNLFSSNVLVSGATNYTKSYLPFGVQIYAPGQIQTNATFVDSYPMVISR